MAYWLVKSEPVKYPWDRFVADRRTHWDGVRNHQAAINLKAMRVGDQAFFYHSNEGKEIVGIAEIVREAYPDPSDPTGRFVMVDLAPVKPVRKPVTLAEIKAEPREFRPGAPVAAIRRAGAGARLAADLRDGGHLTFFPRFERTRVRRGRAGR
jgi:predicted RNA-binding protein with PUA-like domain